MSLTTQEPQFAYVCSGTSNILIARFMLDLRGVSDIRAADDDSLPGVVGTLSSVRFAGNVVDVDHPMWTINASDDVEDADHVARQQEEEGNASVTE